MRYLFFLPGLLLALCGLSLIAAEKDRAWQNGQVVESRAGVSEKVHTIAGANKNYLVRGSIGESDNALDVGKTVRFAVDGKNVYISFEGHEYKLTLIGETLGGIKNSAAPATTQPAPAPPPQPIVQITPGPPTVQAPAAPSQVVTPTRPAVPASTAPPPQPTVQIAPGPPAVQAPAAPSQVVAPTRPAVPAPPQPIAAPAPTPSAAPAPATGTLIPAAQPAIAIAPTSSGEVLDNDAIVKMILAGLKDDTLTRVIEARPGRYVLTPEAIAGLRAAGVSQAVIDAMSATMKSAR